MVTLEDLKKKFRIFYKGLNRQNKIGIFIITIGVVFLILGCVFISLLDSQRIWKPQYSIVNSQISLKNDYFSIPRNDFIQNKYDVIVSAVFVYVGDYKAGSITFRHLATNSTYIFDYYLTPGLYVGEYSTSKTFTMIPGRYHVDGISGGGSKELREHGIIPKDLDWIAYLGLIIGSILIIIMGYKKYLGYSKKETKKRIKRKKYICQKCGAKLSLGYAICLQCGENVQKL